MGPDHCLFAGFYGAVGQVFGQIGCVKYCFGPAGRFVLTGDKRKSVNRGLTAEPDVQTALSAIAHREAGVGHQGHPRRCADIDEAPGVGIAGQALQILHAGLLVAAHVDGGVILQRNAQIFKNLQQVENGRQLALVVGGAPAHDAVLVLHRVVRLKVPAITLGHHVAVEPDAQIGLAFLQGKAHHAYAVIFGEEALFPAHFQSGVQHLAGAFAKGRAGQRLALYTLDIDHFNGIPDQCGPGLQNRFVDLFHQLLFHNGTSVICPRWADNFALIVHHRAQKVKMTAFVKPPTADRLQLSCSAYQLQDAPNDGKYGSRYQPHAKIPSPCFLL